MLIKTAIGVAGLFALSWGGMLKLDARYTPLTSYQAHIDAEESRYVLDLKRAIREIQARLQQDPDNPYLLADLEDTIDTLCEIRPDDKLCD